VHYVRAVLLQVVGCGLFDVENPVEVVWRSFVDAAQKLEQVRYVWTAFIEVERVLPVRCVVCRLRPFDDPIDADDVFEIGRQIAAVQLDLEFDQSVTRDLFLECIREVASPYLKPASTRRSQHNKA